MKHIIKSSVIITLIITCPVFAEITTSNSNPTCDNSTIGAYSGSTEMEAQWTRNTINLKWYSGETEVSSGTCQYDGAITLPTDEPSKPGYTFAGWKVRQLFNLATLANQISTGARLYAYIALDGTNSTYIEYRYFTINTPDVYNLTTPGEWAVEFSYGNVKGIARCASNSGTWPQTGTPEGNEGRYCWCQASGFDPEKDGTYMSVSSPSWVFRDDKRSAASCASECAYYCGFDCRNYSDFRSAVYGITQ